MKKGFFILLSIFLLASCGNNDKQAEKEDAQPIVKNANEDTSYDRHFEDIEELGEVAETTTSANHSNLKDFPEFDQLDAELALDRYSNIVKTDNAGNRVILFNDHEGDSQFKSIYVKDRHFLKIIDLSSHELMFNASIEGDANDTSHQDGKVTRHDELADLPEMETIGQHIDLQAYPGKIETDNPNMRIILFEDDQGQKHYKSIFVKKDNHLKVIQLNGDQLLFNDNL